MITKPFNLEHAKAGAPYACRDGQEAVIAKFDARDPVFPLVGYLGEHDQPAHWSSAGRWVSQAVDSPLDLVMTPLGYIDGKPVFVDDKIEWSTGGEWIPDTAEPLHRDFTNCRWPAAAKQYPVTGMTGAELLSYFDGSIPADQCAIAAANAALRHAIDNGQVKASVDVDKAIDSVMALYRDALANRKARDVAIAEAVQQAAFVAAREGGEEFWAMKINSLNLASIIAGVKS